MNDGQNIYLDLTTYPEIYSELVYERNVAITNLTDSGLLIRDRYVNDKNSNEWKRQQSIAGYRVFFTQKITQVLDRLYSHDATEALYDFRTDDLGGWSNTEANRLERELQSLQSILSKLETRYQLQYKQIFTYNSGQSTLYFNNIEVLSCGPSTVRHRLLTTLFSAPSDLWGYEDIEEYFVKNFDYTYGEIQDKTLEKAANDLKKDVSAKKSVRDFLIVSNSSIRINPSYISN